MHQWARPKGDVFAEWHLLGRTSQTDRGIVVAACGSNLGDGTDLERVDDESIVGHRCAWSSCSNHVCGRPWSASSRVLP
jgi:hypothetical protein